MKKLIYTGMGVMFSFLSFAQEGSKMAQPNSSMNQPIELSKTDGVMMKNGKMIVIKGTLETPMSAEYTCTDGTKVSTTGTVTKKDGTTMMLKEGQYLDKSGNIMFITGTVKADKTKPDNTKKMYLVPDSTAKKMNK